ncbi:kelch domain-containing protein 9 [Pseudophryne corroboree]|uniref:kelch domain-containing protein 9 n=1 Tax=Pseudophryne corroboree TaxID=495146 RepID=UPI0030819863
MAGARWTWTPVARDERFARAHHTCTPVRGKLYLFGGVTSGDSRVPPLGDVVTFQPDQNTTECGAPQSAFRRSHHDTTLLGERWLCSVGGWDGSRRVSSVLSYDTELGAWALWTEGQPSSSPVGLSSHTCTRLSDHELCVVGREGGLRTQRRYASVYTLRVNASTKTYWCKEEESRTASRSGHAAVLLQTDTGHGRRSAYSLYVFGGRDSATADWAGLWSKDKIQENTDPSPLLMEQLSRLVATPNAKRAAPKSLKHHSCSTVGPFVVAFGGETLCKGRDAVCNDLYICDTRCNPVRWFHFPGSDPHHKRVGHRTCLLNDRLYLVGGFGADGQTPCPDICVLDIL